MALGIVAGLAAGGLLGLWAGMRLSARPVWFVVAIVALFGATVAGMARGLSADALWLAGLSLGLLGGGLTGLKYGRDAELRSLLTPPGR